MARKSKFNKCTPTEMVLIRKALHELQQCDLLQGLSPQEHEAYEKLVKDAENYNAKGKLPNEKLPQ